MAYYTVWSSSEKDMVAAVAQNFFFFCESPFICKLYKYIQQMV
jgi:hypothetical protein